MNRKTVALLFTLSWMLLLAGWGFYVNGHAKSGSIPYEQYSKVRFYLSVPFACAALLCLWGYSSGQVFEEKSAALGPWAIAGLVFWVLFPPAWFLVEFHGAASLAFAGADKSDVKEYSELAAKLWAAFLALYGFTISQRIKAREKELEKGRVGSIRRDDESPIDDLTRGE